MVSRTSVRVLVLGACLAAFSVLTPQPANAETNVLVCPAAANFDIDPGLTLLPSAQETSGTVSLGSQLLEATPCTSPTGVPFAGAQGTMTGASSGLGLSCVPTPLGLLGPLNGTGEFDWFNASGQVVGQSTWEWTLTLGVASSTLVGSITSGELAGSTLVIEWVPTGFSGNCVLSPVVAATLTGVATVFQL